MYCLLYHTVAAEELVVWSASNSQQLPAVPVLVSCRIKILLMQKQYLLYFNWRLFLWSHRKHSWGHQKESSYIYFSFSLTLFWLGQLIGIWAEHAHVPTHSSRKARKKVMSMACSHLPPQDKVTFLILSSSRSSPWRWKSITCSKKKLQVFILLKQCYQRPNFQLAEVAICRKNTAKERQIRLNCLPVTIFMWSVTLIPLKFYLAWTFLFLLRCLNQLQ